VGWATEFGTEPCVTLHLNLQNLDPKPISCS
jgi:hypothetical protein